MAYDNIDRVWLITGCSSGFGEELVTQILGRGDKVIATGRHVDKVKHLGEAGAAVLQLDITASQESLNDTIQNAIRIYGRIDVLVNNAAYVAAGTWEDLGYEGHRLQFETNVFGTLKVTNAVLPHFRQRRAGTLVFISSLSGWVGHPFISAYSGSKFALEGMVESLSQDVAPLGIQSLLIEPGRFRTKLLSTGNVRTVSSSIPDYQELSKIATAGLAAQDQTQQGDPEKLVKIIIDVVRHEGVAVGHETPFRLPVGTDCYNEIKEKLVKTLKLLEDWEDVINSTDY